MPSILNSDQQQAFDGILEFLSHPTADTFVLKGYAGTGKTFLMQYLARWLKANEREFKLLASTGRAASVLRGKTGFEAKTVHGIVYKFSKVDGDYEHLSYDAPVDKFGQMTLQFALKPPETIPTIYIVDEASMLSSEIPKDNSFAVFGSGMLLLDFFEHTNNNKIIFVGDPCQLPPVGQSFSPALDIDWLTEHDRKPVEFTLNKIERTREDNDILKLAHKLRDLAGFLHTEKWMKLPAKGLSKVKIYNSNEELIKEYLANFKKDEVNNSLLIARSNKKVREINEATRFEIIGETGKLLQLGEVLLVTQNNFAVPLTNGDFTIVTFLGEIETKGDLHFQNIKVKTLISDEEYSILLSLNILYDSTNGAFTKDQNKFLMVDFSKKMRQLGHKPNDNDYKREMMEDPYLNCLKASYGYAVTCHKSQGGEWDDVYILLDKGMSNIPSNEPYRWWYTAITRAKKHIHLVNNWWLTDFPH
jgi:hypothetical protein